MPKSKDKRQSRLSAFIEHVRSVNAGRHERSEADLSSKFSEALEELELHTVIDTGGAGSTKRPDILVYARREDADLVRAADVVIESKQPAELRGTKGITDALGRALWRDKTAPYIKAHLDRIQYFCLTTFTEFAILRITPDLRRAFASRDLATVQGDKVLADRCRKESAVLSLSSVGGMFEEEQVRTWKGWIAQHFSASALLPLPLSEILGTRPVTTAKDIDRFAEDLADIVAGTGPNDRTSVYGGLRSALPDSLDQLEPLVRQELRLFVLAQHAGANSEAAAKLFKSHFAQLRDEFIAATIHSLISRLFALRIIEDRYCVGSRAPLIPEGEWVFNTKAYDGLSIDKLPQAVSNRLRALSNSPNTVLQLLARVGRFFDWAAGYYDPVAFRMLFECFNAVTFRDLEGDLLGRFFEHYSQRINRKQRKALGQYYTPHTIVRFMWHLTKLELEEGDEKATITVLDPAMGSGTFLSEGARALASMGVERIWERLVGFDVAPQVMGIAQSNLYTALLSTVDREAAGEIKDIRLYTTNTLDSSAREFLEQVALIFEDPEQQAFIDRAVDVSSKIKQHERFRVVIGNPPYKNNSVLTLAQVAERFPRLLASSVVAAKAQVRNIRDDYAWFFAAADQYLAEEAGLICYITSDSYCHKGSYRFLRRELLRHYEVRYLVRLGATVFPDVGPRISFAILLLKRRAKVIEVEDAGPFSYFDLRELAEGAPASALATEDDPRLSLLEEIARGKRVLPKASRHRPVSEHDFSFVPGSQVVERVLADSVGVCPKGETGLFVKKWPGLITAFDVLFKAETEETLFRRISDLYDLAQRLEGASLLSELRQWEEKHRVKLEEAARNRLMLICTQIRQQGLIVESDRIKRSFEGSIPNDERWFPAQKYWCYIYYEPRLHVSRNVHAEKFEGWGTMEQWRDPRSHAITPKLVFTSSTNPAYGYKAYVLGNEWHVKLHGGKSQQFNYTGADVPAGQRRLHAVANNLTEAGALLAAELQAAGGGENALLYYVAGIYNSRLAMEFLDEEPPHELRIKKVAKRTAKMAVTVSEFATELSHLARILAMIPTGKKEVSRRQLLESCDATTLDALHLSPRRAASRGYQSTYFYDVGQLTHAATRRFNASQAQLDDAVERLYAS